MQVRTNRQLELKSAYLQKKLSGSTKIWDWVGFAAGRLPLTAMSAPTSRRDSETLQGFYREPYAVYVTAKSEKFYLKKLTDCNLWKLEKFTFNLRRYQSNPWFTFEIWIIRFEICGRELQNHFSNDRMGESNEKRSWSLFMSDPTHDLIKFGVWTYNKTTCKSPKCHKVVD